MKKMTITLLLIAVAFITTAQHVNFDWMARLITARPSHTEMYGFKDVKVSNCKNIEFLYLDGSKENTKRIIQVLKLTKNLKYLTITSSYRLHQDSIMHTLCLLKHLEALELVHADTIMKDISKLNRLKWLIFNEGTIRVVPKSIYRLRRLEMLSFGHAYSHFNRGNDITELPAGLSKLKRLEYIFLKRNPIHSISDEFCKLKNLKKVLVSESDTMDYPECLKQKLYF